MPFMKRQVAGSTFNRKGTSTVEPNMAKRCCSERGMVGRSGSRSSTSMILLLIRFSFLIVTGKWGDRTSGGGLLASRISIPPWRIGKGGSERIASPGKKEAFVKRKSLLPLPDCEFLSVIFYSFCERKASGGRGGMTGTEPHKRKNDEAFVSSLFFCGMPCSLMLAF